MIRYLLPGVWLAWGLSYPLMAWSLEAVDMFSSRLIVMALGGLILLAVGTWIERAAFLPERGAWRQIAVAALFNMTLFQVFLISGVLLMGPGRTSIVIYTMPAWSALFAVLLLKERVSARVVAALCLGLAAVAIIFVQGTAATMAPLGCFFALLAAVSFGLGTVLTKRMAFRGNLSIIAAWQLLIGAALIIPVWLAFSADAYARLDQSRGVLALGFLTLVSNSLAYFCWFRVIRALPASVAGMTTLVVPCIGFGSSALLAGDPVSLADVVALGLILASVTLTLARRDPAPGDTRATEKEA